MQLRGYKRFPVKSLTLLSMALALYFYLIFIEWNLVTFLICVCDSELASKTTSFIVYIRFAVALKPASDQQAKTKLQLLADANVGLGLYIPRRLWVETQRKVGYLDYF